MNAGTSRWAAPGSWWWPLTGPSSAALDELTRRAAANGLEAERLGPDGIADHEPHVAGVAALKVPETAVVDFGVVAQAFAAEAATSGVEIRTGFEVVAAHRETGHWRLESPAGPLTTRLVVNCAGLQVDRFSELLGHQPGVRIIPFRGEYRSLRPERTGLINGLVYPVPDPRFPFLGVHFTKDLAGSVEIGPNAVLALAREGYRRSQVNGADLRALVTSRRLMRLGRRYWRTGAGEVWRSLSTKAFVRNAARLVPALTAADLAGHRSGVRAQAVRPDGTLVDDFVIEDSPGAVHILNAPSPGATASIAIGDHIVDRTLAHLEG